MLMSKKKVHASIPASSFHLPSYMRKSFSHPPKKTELLWKSDKTSFRLHIVSATYVNAKEADQIFVRVGLFHGTEPLCQVAETKRIPYANPR